MPHTTATDFAAVSCSAPTFCEAVGNFGTTAIGFEPTAAQLAAP